MHTYMHTYIHTYIHTYTYKFMIITQFNLPHLHLTISTVYTVYILYIARVTMAENLNRKKGSNTPQYQVMRSHYFNLVLNFESVLPQFTAKCFEKKLISTNDKDASNNTSQPLFDRSRALLDRILTKIQINSEWYVVLLNILQDFPELERIRCELNESFLLSTVRNRKLSKTLHLIGLKSQVHPPGCPCKRVQPLQLRLRNSRSRSHRSR